MGVKKLLNIFVAISVTFILFIVGFFALTPKDIEVSGLKNPDNLVADSECVGNACEVESSVSMTGVVEIVSDNEVVTKQTHQLEDDSGVILAYLQANDDKLKLVEGMGVEIKGVRLSLLIEGVPVIEVEEVRFK